MWSDFVEKKYYRGKQVCKNANPPVNEIITLRSIDEDHPLPDEFTGKVTASMKLMFAIEVMGTEFAVNYTNNPPDLDRTWYLVLEHMPRMGRKMYIRVCW